MKMTTPPLVCMISGENARPGVGAIRMQSRESRNPERGRLVKIGFLDACEQDRTRESEVVQYSWLKDLQHSIEEP